MDADKVCAGVPVLPVSTAQGTLAIYMLKCFSVIAVLTDSVGTAACWTAIELIAPREPSQMPI